MKDKHREALETKQFSKLYLGKYNANNIKVRRKTLADSTELALNWKNQDCQSFTTLELWLWLLSKVPSVMVCQVLTECLLGYNQLKCLSQNVFGTEWIYMFFRCFALMFSTFNATEHIFVIAFFIVPLNFYIYLFTTWIINIPSDKFILGIIWN